MWTFLLGLALGAEDSDLVATAVVHAPPAAVYAALLDLDRQRQLWPEDCAKSWQMGDPHRGEGATASLIWVPSVMHRRLPARISKVEPDRRITVDHEGRKGFTLTWTLSAVEGGTAVELHTWILPPPRPFLRLWSKRVRPAWQACHVAAVQRLAATLAP